MRHTNKQDKELQHLTKRLANLEYDLLIATGKTYQTLCSIQESTRKELAAYFMNKRKSA